MVVVNVVVSNDFDIFVYLPYGNDLVLSLEAISKT